MFWSEGEEALRAGMAMYMRRRGGRAPDLGKVARRELIQVSWLLANDLFGIGLEDLAEVVRDVDLLRTVHWLCDHRR